MPSWGIWAWASRRLHLLLLPRLHLRAVRQQPQPLMTLMPSWGIWAWGSRRLHLLLLPRLQARRQTLLTMIWMLFWAI